MLSAALVLAGLCSVWLIETALVLRNVASLRTLGDVDAPEPHRWPKVSAVVPSRDEARSLQRALCSRLDDGYPDLELVVVDDRSTDETPEMLRRLSECDPRVKPLRIEELPPGWLGKVHAMETGAQAATGEWLLMSDADIVFEPGALRRAVAVCIAEKIDFLALVPEFKSTSWLVDVLWAVFMRVFSMTYDPARVRDPASKTAAGSGSFMLLRREVYDRSPGFEWLRMETADDMALGLMMKRAGARCELMNARGSISVSVYHSVAEFVRGVEKNGASLASTPFPLVAALMALAGAVEWAPAVSIALGLSRVMPDWLLPIGVAALVLQIGSTAVALHINTGMVAPALLAPFGWVLMAGGVLRSTWLAKRRGGVYWRETFYPLEDLIAGQRFRLEGERQGTLP